MSILTMSAQVAYKNQENEASRWASGSAGALLLRLRGTAGPRVRAALYSPALNPKFMLSPATAFFAIGSCFARVLEEALIPKGYSVLSDAAQDFEEFAGEKLPRFRVNGILNKYNVFSMLNELRWSLGEVAFPEEALLRVGEDTYMDPHVLPIHEHSTRDRTLARRAAVSRSFGRVRQAGLVVITLGLSEVWFDRKMGLYMNVAPPKASVAREPDRFEFRIADLQETVLCLDEIYGLLRKHCPPQLRVLLTVSPVALQITSSGQDVVVANSYSKSLLRTAAGEFVGRHGEDVDYFPSYEIAVTSKRERVFLRDLRHVSPTGASHIIALFESRYLVR